MHSAPSNLSQRCLKLTSGNYWHRVRKYSKTVPFMKTTWILPRGDMWLDSLLSFCTPFILHWPELVLKCFDYSIYGSRLLPTLCCSFATNNCTKRKPWNTLFLDFHSAFPWLSEAYSRWDAFLHHAKPRCSKAVRMLKPRDIRNQVRWMTSIYVPVFKDFLQVERLKLCLKRRAKKDFAYFYQYLFTIQLSPVKNYDFTLWISLFCSWIQVWSSILSSCGWNAHDQAWGLKR